MRAINPRWLAVWLEHGLTAAIRWFNSYMVEHRLEAYRNLPQLCWQSQSCMCFFASRTLLLAVSQGMKNNEPPSMNHPVLRPI